MSRIVAFLLALSALAIMAAGLPSCSGSARSIEQTAVSPPSLSAQALLAELEALPAPDGVDEAVFSELKSAFAALIAADALPTCKQTSAGLGTDVTDLNVQDQGGGDILLTWTYRHLGDYDQNGEVNISDLSPIGMHFHKTTASGDWNVAQAADGDANGEVNVADVTPIGQNYGSVVTGYRIESTATPGDDGSWVTVTEVQFSQGTLGAGQAFRTFSAQLSGQAAGLSYRAVPLVTTTGSGNGGNYDEQEDNDTGATANALPAQGVSGFTGSSGNGAGYSGYDGDANDYFSIALQAGQHVDISLALNTATGDLDLYLLNGSGDILLRSENTDANELIQAIINVSATFYIGVHCYSGYSDYTLGVAVTGGSGNQAPQAALTASPTSGPVPLVVNFDASGSSDPDGTITTFEWDWEDNGTYDHNTGATPTAQCTYTAGSGTVTVRVRVTDDGGLTDTATTQITLGGGGFVEPPVETFVDYSQAGDTAERKWLLNCYRVLPPWQDTDRVFQSTYFRDWADEILTLTNQERANNGLPALTFDPHLELVAQAHGRDLALQQYFSHTNLYGMGFTDRLDAVERPPYTPGEDIAGENILRGLAPNPDDSPAQTVTWWMNSPGHRANILNPNVTHLGVGAYYYTGDPGNHFAYFVQVFANWSVDPDTHDWLEPEEVPAP